MHGKELRRIHEVFDFLIEDCGFSLITNDSEARVAVVAYSRSSVEIRICADFFEERVELFVEDEEHEFYGTPMELVYGGRPPSDVLNVGSTKHLTDSLRTLRQQLVNECPELCKGDAAAFARHHATSLLVKRGRNLAYNAVCGVNPHRMREALALLAEHIGDDERERLQRELESLEERRRLEFDEKRLDRAEGWPK